jgi:hypothetical protein
VIDTPAPPPPRSRRVPAAIAGLSLLAGAAVAVVVLLLAGWRHVPVQRFEMTVMLKPGSTVETYAEMARLYAEDGDTPPDSVTPMTASRSLVLVTSGRSFDCEPFAGLQRNAGVRTVVIAEFLDGGPTAAFDC